MRSHEFSLPQGTIRFPHALPAHICTLVTGGRPPPTGCKGRGAASSGRSITASISATR